jgi:transcriptional regulator with XRE-family HTH domain
MSAIQSELDRLLDEHDARAREAERRRNLSRGVYESHRRRALKDYASLHPLKRRRLTFRHDGLSVEELADRALVAASTIRALENGEPGSDLTWTRLARALDVRRPQIDPSWIKP